MSRPGGIHPYTPLTMRVLSAGLSCMGAIGAAAVDTFVKYAKGVNENFLLYFYRAMHFSAKRGIAIACRLCVRPSVCLSVCLSVCPSVTLVDQDHIGRKANWKLIMHGHLA